MIVTVFDTETTGLINSGLLDLDKQPEVIEFAAIKFNLDSDEQIAEYECLIKPKRNITAEITNITGISNAMVEDRPTFQAQLYYIKEALEQADAVVAHNLSFDMEIINIEMKRLGTELKWPDRRICTVEQTMPYKGYRVSLSDLHESLFNGEKFDGAHRAINDVKALVRCVKTLYKMEYI